MPTLNIEGKRVKVDDSFLSLSPEEQNATVEEIARSLGVGAQAEATQPAQPQPGATPAYRDGAFSAVTEGSHAGLMGGFDDEIGAGMMAPIHAGIDWFKGDGFSIPKAYNRLQQQLDARKGARREEHPVASIAGEVAGGLATGAGASKVGLTLAARPAKTIAARVGLGAAEGAGYGALYGAGEAKPGERLEGAGQGAAFGAVAGGALGGLGGAMANRTARKAMPAASSDDLAAAANNLYSQSRAAGVTVKAPAFNRVARNIEMAAGRINRDLRPNTAGIVDDVQSLRGRNITLEELDELRQVVNQSMKGAQPQDVRTLERIKTTLDHFADNVKPGDITGDIKGFEYIKQGRELWHRKMKADILNEIVEKAKNQATGFENGLVANFRALANNKAKMRSFSAEEQKMIKDVVRRGSVHGILRALGMLSPNSTFGGLMTGGVGVGAGILPGAALAGTGMAARSAAGAMTRGKVDALQRAVSAGAPVQFPALPNRLAPLIPASIEASRGVPRTLEGSR